MDKTFNNLMDIVSRTKKIDEKEGKVPRPKKQVVEETFDEPKKELKPAKTSLFEGKDAISKYLGNKKEPAKKSTTKKSTSTKSTSTKKSTTKKSSTTKAGSKKTTTKKTTTKASSTKTTKPKTSASAESKKQTAKEIADKFQLINNKKVVKPIKQEPALDMNDPKNVELYNALKDTLFAGGTDVSEYMEDNNLNAQKLSELYAQKKARKVTDDITREQQEYEKLFTGSFFGEESQNEEMSDDKLQEYLAGHSEEGDQIKEPLENENISDQSAEENDETFETIRKNRFDVDLDEYQNRDRELDEKIADYYKRKQEKINAYNETFDEEKEEPKEENKDIDYESIFNGEVEKRSVVMGEEEEEEEEIEEVPEPQTSDFQTLYQTLNYDNFDGYDERYITPASELPHGENFVSPREESEEDVELEEKVETPSTQSFEDEEMIESEMDESIGEDEAYDQSQDDIYDLSDDDNNLDDYIVSSNVPLDSNDKNNEDSTMIISTMDLPEYKVNYIDEDNEDDEERIIDGDAISKQEFYSEMARLQENLLNELKSENKQEEEKEKFDENVINPSNSTLEKALDIINNLTQVQAPKAEVKNIEPETIENISTNVVANTQEENIEEETLDENSEPDEKDYAKIFADVEEVVDEKEEVVSEESDITFGVISENGDVSLLNKDVALNESDLEYIVNSEKNKSEKSEYFYMSEEDVAKKKEDESMIVKTVSQDGKEMGDINLNKDIKNVTPSSEVLEEKITPSKVDDMEVIYTIFGMQKKKADKNREEIKVLYVTSECLPFVATGGLADVAGSLPKAINKVGGVDVRVIMPLYGKIKNEYADKLEYICNFTVHLSWRQEYCGLFKYTADGVTYYFVDNERYFKRNSLYGFYDDGERFAYFCKAIVEGLPMLNFFPDIIHCNDWQSSLVSTYIKTGNWSDFRYYKIKNIYTIHNVEYQGVYGMENLKDLFGIDDRFKNDLEYNGDINLTKSAIQFSDKFTTVSNSYCDNLKQPYCSRGLHHIIIRNEYKLSGIINGVDYDFYNPAKDNVIYKNYDINSIEDKVYNKKILQDEMGLPVDGKTPMIAMATRLVSHKGLDLVTKILEEVLSKDVQFVICGTGDQRYIDYFKYLENKYPTKVRALVDKYSNENARKLYAASDIFLMPSKIEPCGISQMIASKYGSIPIVREVGGLRDTIKDFGCVGGGNGYTFANYNPNDLLNQINKALGDYRDENGWREKMKTVMSMDFSWENSARKYVDLYKSLVE